MIFIPLYSLLFVYLLFLAVFSVFFIFNIYHIISTGTFTKTALVVIFLICALIMVVFYATWYLLADIDWQAPFINLDLNFFNLE